MEQLGIDIGGTGIKGAIVNTTTGERITERVRIKTPQPATPEAVIETARKVKEELGWQGSAGFGFPAAIRNGIVKTASNIAKEWIGKPINELFTHALGAPARVVNDVDAAGVAEMSFGRGREHSGSGSVMMIALGTGIGSALFTEGHLVPNTELGHLILHNQAAELYVSNRVRETQDLNWQEWGLRLNEYLNMLNDRFWPDLIILGGGVSKKFDRFAKYLEVEAEVVPANLRNHAGIVGAAMIAPK